MSAYTLSPRIPRAAATMAVALLLTAGTCGGPKGGPPVAAPAAVFQVVDKTPQVSPCPQDENGIDVSQDEFDSLGAIIAEILSDEAGIVADIEAQIRRVVPDDKERDVEVTVSVCTCEEFRRDYVADLTNATSTDEDRARLGREADEICEKFGGFAYTGKTRTVRVKIFCKRGLAHVPTNADDIKRLRELVIHELVHAKLFSMQWLGVAEADLPFQNHGDPPQPEGRDRDFYREAARLLGLLGTSVPVPVVSCELPLLTITCKPPCPGGQCCPDDPTPRGFLSCATICDPEQPHCREGE